MYSTFPPMSLKGELSNLGRLNVKGSLPWNQGFTVCRSVDTTSTGLVLARVEMWRSTKFATACCRDDFWSHKAPGTARRTMARARPDSAGSHLKDQAGRRFR